MSGPAVYSCSPSRDMFDFMAEAKALDAPDHVKRLRFQPSEPADIFFRSNSALRHALKAAAAYHGMSLADLCTAVLTDWLARPNSATKP